jgi:predicted DsbA family dithiol-disulfide isomerase
MTAAPMPLDPAVRLDVWADIACPWCYIGTKRLSTVLDHEQAAGREVVVRHRPFELQPDLPVDGVPMRPFFEATFGGPDAMRRVFERTADAGRDVGIAFDFDAMPKAPNTRLAHALVVSYDGDERQRAVLETLFAAYFEHGLDVTDRTVLSGLIVDLTGEPGVDVARRFESTIALDAELLAGVELGVDAVPMFVADAGTPNDALGLSAAAIAVQGAQPERTLVHLLEQARARAGA